MISKTEQPGGSEKEIVAVTEHGRATIPERFREKLGIEAPGKVLFREVEGGEVIIEYVRSPSEMRGFAAVARRPPTGPHPRASARSVSRTARS